METIRLKKLSLINFKGIKSLTINFNQTTNIFGNNATGKTTVFDSFTWLFFGKDHTDRKDFEIKTLDKNNKVIPQIDHEVSAIIQLPNEEIEIKRILREKWQKKRGSLNAEFTGNETLYFWNEVPKSQKEFQEKVATILDEMVFKLITNPGAFNNLKWQDRRNVLIQIVGDVSDAEIAKGNEEFEALLSQLTNKTLDEYKKQLASQRKKINDELKSIPTRIDEVSRNTPDALNFEQLKTDKSLLEKSLGLIQSQIDDKAKAFDAVLEKRNAVANEVFTIKGKMSNIEFETKQTVNNTTSTDTSELDQLKQSLFNKKGTLSSYDDGVKDLNTQIEAKESQIKTIEESMASKRIEWEKENASELSFDDKNFACPTCKRDFEASDVETKKEELTINFNKKQSNTLIEIQNAGKSLVALKEVLENEIVVLNERIKKADEPIKTISLEIINIESNIDNIESNPKEETKTDPQAIIDAKLIVNEKYQDLKKELTKKENSLNNQETINTDDLKKSKETLVAQIDEIKSQLLVEQQINTSDKRVKELENQESTLAQEMVEKEKDLFTIEQFTKKKIDTLENLINQKFKFVKFKLFEIQINGAEVECCHTLIDGVPYGDANTASKINAGLDIINTLCEHYKMTAPIFIDNRESIVEIVECQSQIINLIVDKNEKKLKVA